MNYNDYISQLNNLDNEEFKAGLENFYSFNSGLLRFFKAIDNQLKTALNSPNLNPKSVELIQSQVNEILPILNKLKFEISMFDSEKLSKEYKEIVNKTIAYVKDFMVTGEVDIISNQLFDLLKKNETAFSNEREARKRQEQEEKERIARKEAKRRDKEERERKDREESERKAKEEKEHREREERERIAKEKAILKAKEERERKERKELEHKAKGEKERHERVEKERIAKAEMERKEKKEREKRDAEQRIIAEQERIKREELLRKIKPLIYGAIGLMIVALLILVIGNNKKIDQETSQTSQEVTQTNNEYDAIIKTVSFNNDLFEKRSMDRYIYPEIVLYSFLNQSREIEIKYSVKRPSGNMASLTYDEKNNRQLYYNSEKFTIVSGENVLKFSSNRLRSVSLSLWDSEKNKFYTDEGSYEFTLYSDDVQVKPFMRTFVVKDVSTNPDKLLEIIVY